MDICLSLTVNICVLNAWLIRLWLDYRHHMWVQVTRWCSGQDVGLMTRSRVQFPAMALPHYFWDKRPYFAGKLSWDITTTQVNPASHSSGVSKLSTGFGWGKFGKLTAVGWQVTLCDPIWHVISRSGVVMLTTDYYIRFTSLCFTMNWVTVPCLVSTVTEVIDTLQDWHHDLCSS